MSNVEAGAELLRLTSNFEPQRVTSRNLAALLSISHKARGMLKYSGKEWECFIVPLALDPSLKSIGFPGYAYGVRQLEDGECELIRTQVLVPNESEWRSKEIQSWSTFVSSPNCPMVENVHRPHLECLANELFLPKTFDFFGQLQVSSHLISSKPVVFLNDGPHALGTIQSTRPSRLLIAPGPVFFMRSWGAVIGMGVNEEAELIRSVDELNQEQFDSIFRRLRFSSIPKLDSMPNVLTPRI